MYVLQRYVRPTALCTSYSAINVLQRCIRPTALYPSYSAIYVLQRYIRLTALYTSYSAMYVLQHYVRKHRRYDVKRGGTGEKVAVQGDGGRPQGSDSVWQARLTAAVPPGVDLPAHVRLRRRSFVRRRSVALCACSTVS
jgi:hypothetical protein